MLQDSTDEGLDLQDSGLPLGALVGGGRGIGNHPDHTYDGFG